MDSKFLRILTIVLILSGLSFSAASAMFEPPAPALPLPGDQQELTGYLLLVWGDSDLYGSSLHVSLATEDGQEYALDDDPSNIPLDTLLAWNGQKVHISVLPALSGSGRATERMEIQSISPITLPSTPILPHSPQSQFGHKPWVTLMCKFSDVATEPYALSFFQGMYGDAAGRLNHYWSELSYGQMDVAGSAAYGWFTLPSPHSAYIVDSDFDRRKAANDCTALADSQVDFSQFSGINLFFNSDLYGGASYGGQLNFTPGLDGKTMYYLTWMALAHYSRISVVEHEMGHGFGLPHSVYDDTLYGTYQNDWDVMSDTDEACAAFSDATYGCMGQGTIGFHKDLLGWLPAGKVLTVTLGSKVSAKINWLGAATSADYRLVKVPVQGTNLFYTIEARGYPTTGTWKTYDYKFYGYLHPYGDQAIILHKVDWHATIVDPDGNNDASDNSAIFTAGESYTIPGYPITINVLSAQSDGLTVEVDNYSTTLIKGSPADTAANASLRPTLTWGGAAGATEYQYCLNTASATCAGSWTSAAMNHSVTIGSDLALNTKYYWQVRANTPGGFVYANTGVWYSFTTLDKPSTFSKTTPTHGSDDQPSSISFKWEASANAATYEFCLNYNPVASPCWYSKTTSSTQVNLSSLSAGLTLFWQVTAVGPGGRTTSNNGKFWQTTITGGTHPAAFGKLAPAGGSSGLPVNALAISWNAAGGASGYEYCYDTLDDNICSGTWLSSTTPNAVLNGLMPGTTYYWQVRALGGRAAYADSGSYWSFSTSGTPPKKIFIPVIVK